MANRAVTLMRNCKTPDGWRRYRAVIGKNGRVKPGFALVKGKHASFPDGHYEVRYYVGSKVAYRNVGTDAAEALAACAKHGKLLVAKDTAKAAGAVIVEEKGRMPLDKALLRFVEAANDRGSAVAADKYKLSGEEFLQVTGRRYADEVQLEDFTLHQRALRKRGSSARTIANRHSYVLSFLRYAGVPQDRLPTSAPKYEKTLPEVYSKAETDALFTSLDDKQQLLTFHLALKTGLREQELMHLQWADVNLDRRTLLVRSKPEWNFWIKDKEERVVPIPDTLLTMLHDYREEGPRLFITGTSGDRPNTHLLRTLKRLVKAAGLHCGSCVSCAERGECEQWFLHKFRATYVTTWLRNGMDLRSVMKLSGHSDIESVMRYLRPAEEAELQAKVNSIVW